MPNSIQLFKEQLDYIAEVTSVLNNHLPEGGDIYVHVELRDAFGTKIGQWSDELAHDNWSFEMVEVG